MPRTDASLLFDASIHALMAARDAALPALDPAIALLRARKGLLVVTGCGKSAFAARKMASMIATLGGRATFLDAGAALHGDGAILGKDDVLAIISRSGETDELVRIATAAPCPVLVLTARPHSRLGRAALCVVPTGDVADPVAGVPTASYLAASAVADVLALESMRGSDGRVPQPPAHPAGAVGVGGRIRVDRVMHHPAPTVQATTPMAQVLQVLTDRALGAVVLVEDGLLKGIITDGDLRRAVARLGPAVFGGNAESLATHRPVAVRESASLQEALDLMERRPSQIAVLPVVDEGDRVVGLVRLHDLVQAGMG